MLTLGFALLTLTLPTGSSTALNLLVGAGIPVASVVILSSLVPRWPWLQGSSQQYLFVATVTWAVVCLTSTTLLIVPALPGSLARHEYSKAALVEVPGSATSGIATTGGLGNSRGVAAYDGRSYAVQNLSNLAATVTWFDSAEIYSDFYAEVRARRADGPTDATACALVFGRTARHPDRWYQFNVSDSGAQLTQTDGGSGTRVVAGPTALPFASDMSSGHRLAVLRHGRSVIMLVDDRKAIAASLPSDQTEGSLSFGTANLSYYRADMACAFTSPWFRQRSRS